MDFSKILTEHGLAVVIIFCLFAAISWFAKWFFNNYTANLDTKFTEMLREIAEVKTEVIADNDELKKTVDVLHSITVKLIDNEKGNEMKLSELASNLDTLLKYIKADK